MKHFLGSLTLLLCVLINNFQEIDINSLKKDPLMIRYQKVQKEIYEGTLNKRYQFPNDPNISKVLASNPSKENMKKVLKEKGMANADEYVDKLFLRTSLMFEFIKKHPELSKLEASKKQSIMRQLLTD